LPPNVVAYVALAGSGSNLGFGEDVVPVNVTSGSEAVGARIRVGTYPDAIAIDGATAYVANYVSNSVTPIDLTTGKALASIPAGEGPAAIAISTRLDRAYVTDDGTSTSLGHTVTPIDLKTGKAMAPIDVGAGPQGIVVTPDGKYAYVADAGAIISGQAGPVGHTVTPIDLETGVPGRPITVGNGPTGIAITPDGSTVYTTNLDSQSVSPIDTSTNHALAAIAVPGAPIAVAVGHGYAWVVDTPSSTARGNNVVPISASTGRAGKPIPVGKGAAAIAITPDGTTAWVACLNAEALIPISLGTKRAAAGIKVADGPFALAITTESVTPSGAQATTTTTKSKKKKSSQS
jgi:YVTN family beta-propeller protein